MPYRRFAAVACSAAALLVAGAGVSSASAPTVSPRVRSRHGQPDGAARRARGRRHRPSAEAQRRERRAVRRRPPALREAPDQLRSRHSRPPRAHPSSDGVERLRKCSTTKLEVRMTVRRGSHTFTVTDRRTLALDPRRCPAAAAPQPRSRSRRCPRRSPPTTRVRRPRRLPPSPRRLPPSPRRRRIPALFRRRHRRSSTSRRTRRWPLGGYGSNYIVTGGVHDPLQVRAFFIGHGKQAVAFVSVDSQGWFAAYQAPNAGDGADDARRDAAAGARPRAATT